MSLQHALLVSLAEREATGYDLTRRFDRSLGFFWSATHQQIYRVLGRMSEDGLVDVRTERGAGKPDRRVYSLTPAGSAELRRWSATPTPSEAVRSEFAVKIRGMQHGDPQAVLDDIRRARDHHAQQLAYFDAECAKHYPHPASLTAAERPLYAVLRGGIRTEQAMLAWCDEMLDLFTSGVGKVPSKQDLLENHDHIRRPSSEPWTGRSGRSNTPSASEQSGESA